MTIRPERNADRTLRPLLSAGVPDYQATGENSSCDVIDRVNHDRLPGADANCHDIAPG